MSAGRLEDSLEELYAATTSFISAQYISKGMSYIAIVVEGGEGRKLDIVSLAIKLRSFLESSRVRRTMMRYETTPLTPSRSANFVEYMRSSASFVDDLVFFVYDPERRLSEVLDKDGREIYVLNL